MASADIRAKPEILRFAQDYKGEVLNNKKGSEGWKDGTQDEKGEARDEKREAQDDRR